MNRSRICLDKTLCNVPDAAALVRGGGNHADIRGKVLFYQTDCGVLVLAEVDCLPESGSQIFGFHIHSGSNCCGTPQEPFADALGHYNPCEKEHPCHAGDMPPLFGNCGHAFMVFLTNRFCVKDIIGRTVIIHAKPDDFTTQPSGNSGEMIACGEIMGREEKK